MGVFACRPRGPRACLGNEKAPTRTLPQGGGSSAADALAALKRSSKAMLGLKPLGPLSRRRAGVLAPLALALLAGCGSSTGNPNPGGPNMGAGGTGIGVGGAGSGGSVGPQ